MTSATTALHGYNVNMLQQLIGDTLPFEHNKEKGEPANMKIGVACLLNDDLSDDKKM